MQHSRYHIEFQFHNGSIKSAGKHTIDDELLGFNSTMVRLKVHQPNL